MATVASIALAAGSVLFTTGSATAADPPVEADTEIVAWGNDSVNSNLILIPPSFQNKSVKSVTTFGARASAITNSGQILQWGQFANGTDDAPPGMSPTAELRFGTGTSTYLAIGNDGAPTVWGEFASSYGDLPEGLDKVKSLAGNFFAGAAVKDDGTVTIWSDETNLEHAGAAFTTIPESLTDSATANAKQIVVGGHSSSLGCCGNSVALVVRDDGSVTSWGNPWALGDESVLDVPEDLGTVKSLTMGGLTSGSGYGDVFAITSTGKLRSWGSDLGADASTLPTEDSDKLAEVSANNGLILGRTSDNRLLMGAADESAQAVLDNAPMEKLEGRKILSVAAGENAAFVVTAAPDPISIVDEATLEGNPIVSGVLTGTPATFSEDGVEVDNEWLADGAPIDGETSTTLELTKPLAGKKISFRSTGTLGDDTVVSVSDETASVVHFFATKAPSLTGVAKVGETLTGIPGEFSETGDAGPPFPLSSWEVNGDTVDISPTYTIKPSDEGKTIAFRTRDTLMFVGGDITSDPIGPVVAEDAEVDPMSIGDRAAVTGEAKVGRTLTGTPATFNGDPDSVANQWLADGAVIDGETGVTYQPIEADEYKQISFRSTATRGEETLTSTSNPTSPIQPGKVLEVESEASVSGTAKSGSTLTGTPATFNLAEAMVSSRWLADGAPIDGATGSTLELGSAQVGKKISFESTATFDGVSVVSTSDETATVADVDLAKLTDPSISGTPQVAKTLTGTPGTFNAGTVTNQWLANGVAINGATGTTYTLVEADEGKTVTFRSTATRGDDTLSSTSAGVGPVLPEILPITITKESSITGTAQVGIALTGVPAEFDGDGAVTFEWLVDGEAVDGATGTTYTPVAADEGKMIAFRTIATSGDIALPSTSAPVGPVLPAAEDPDEEPGGDDTKDKIKVLPDSTFKVGETIKVDVGDEFAGEDVSAFLFSTPFSLGTYAVAANGQITLTIPMNAPLGAHKFAVYNAAGDLIGWQNVLVQNLSGGFGPGGSVGPDGRLLPNTGAGMPGYAVPMGILLVLGGLALAVPARARKLKGAHRLPA